MVLFNKIQHHIPQILWKDNRKIRKNEKFWIKQVSIDRLQKIINLGINVSFEKKNYYEIIDHRDLGWDKKSEKNQSIK